MLILSESFSSGAGIAVTLLIIGVILANFFLKLLQQPERQTSH